MFLETGTALSRRKPVEVWAVTSENHLPREHKYVRLPTQPASCVLFKMPQCKAFGCFNCQGTSKNADGSHKGFFRFPNPMTSAENKKLCGKWLSALCMRKIDLVSSDGFQFVYVVWRSFLDCFLHLIEFSIHWLFLFVCLFIAYINLDFWIFSQIQGRSGIW